MTEKVDISKSTRQGRGKKTKTGPTLWQIFFNDEDPSASTKRFVKLEDKTNHGEAVTYNMRKNPFELDGASASSEEEEVEADGATANGHIRTQVQNEVVIFEKKKQKTEPNEGQPILTKGYEERNWESMDLSETANQDSSSNFPGKKFLIRTDSDLELALPASDYRKWSNSCQYCCVGCPKWPLWRDYLLVVLVGLVILGAWAGVLAGIILGLGGA